MNTHAPAVDVRSLVCARCAGSRYTQWLTTRDASTMSRTTLNTDLRAQSREYPQQWFEDAADGFDDSDTDD